MFENAASRDAALQAAYTRTVLEFDPPEPAGPWGLKKWMVEHKAQCPGNALLAKQLDEWVCPVRCIHDIRAHAAV